MPQDAKNTLIDQFDRELNIQDDVEMELEDNDPTVSLMDRPFDPAKINIETKTPSLDTLIKRMERHTIQMDTDSYFQRKDDLWDKVKQSRLIESILINFPLPAFFFDASDDNNWLVVDGLQRLSSIRNFCVEKTLKLTNLEFLEKLNGIGWDELSMDLQRIIEEHQVVIYKILPGTPTDVKFNIFKRINTGGLVLEPQEIRHALFQGKPSVFIKELAQNSSFIKATGGKIKTHRMLDRDFANRFLAFYLLGIEDYNSDLDTYMSKAMAKVGTFNDEELNSIKRDFTKAMDISYSIFGDKSFRKISLDKSRTPPVNKALFDAISTRFSFLNEEEAKILIKNKEDFKSELAHQLASDSEFFTSISSSTGDRFRVKRRHDKINEIIKKVLNP